MRNTAMLVLSCCLFITLIFSACKDEEEPEQETVIEHTFQDSETGLEWQDNRFTSTKSHNDAKEYCNSATMNGYTDWRLPTQDELCDLKEV